MRSLLPCLLLLIAVPCFAQHGEIVTEVRADLDRDGVGETYTLTDGGDLVVREGDWERVVPDAAWVGPLAGQKPSLAINEAGSVLLSSMNEGMGRDRWRMTLAIAHRKGDWRIAGYTYDYYDPLDASSVPEPCRSQSRELVSGLSWVKRCSLKLLLGKSAT